MDFRRLERIYEEQYIDREWWGEFSPSARLVKPVFEVKSLTDLAAICAKIAFYITGEIPRIEFTNKAPNLLLNPTKITINIKLLRLDIPWEIRIKALFGCFVHELGHLLYTRQDIEQRENKRYSENQLYFLHMLEDRRVESKLAQDFPGYQDFLHVSRRLMLAVGWEIIEQGEEFITAKDALCNYICSRILFPNLLEDIGYLKRVGYNATNRYPIQQVENLLGPVSNYAGLTFQQLEVLATQLIELVGDEEVYCENFFIREMRTLLKGVEDFKLNREIQLAESVIRKMQKTLNPAKVYFDLPSVRPQENRIQKTEKCFESKIRETVAVPGEIAEKQLAKAKELSESIRLSLSMFSAKMDKTYTLYEQDAGEPDEEELHQVRFSRDLFLEEIPAPSVYLEVVILLDLSGSMITGDKIRMQTEISVALALAFEKYANIIPYSLYGHRGSEQGIEIICFKEAGKKLQLEKLFYQEAVDANADAYAMEYCFGKYKSNAPHKLFIMISDGTPSMIGYEGEDARDRIREVIHNGKKQNIEVLSVGIENFEQEDIYEEFIPYSGPETAVKLSKWLRKKFNTWAEGPHF